MKDLWARDGLRKLAEKLGFQYLDGINEFTRQQTSGGIAGHGDRILALEVELMRMKDNLRPVCKSCGQKIQDGFRDGQIEQVAAAVRKTDKKK